MKKWWHTIASVGMGALTLMAPQIQTVIAAHPAISAALAFAWAVLGHVLPSPVASAK